jgi:2-polyprenyl-3-methyl-5-hydroxy-6-metoxy-1,4-benzoquinol methylase
MGRYKTKAEMSFLRRHLGKNDLTVLDIGGGSGRFALALAEEGRTVTVVDVSREALSQLTQHNPPNIRTVHRDFLSSDISERFDAVIAMETFPDFVGVDFGELFAKVPAIST